jgi:transposase-like protein
LYAVFFNLRYPGSYRDLEEIMEERGVDVDHGTLNGIAKLLAACRRVLLVCKLRHHLDCVFCPDAERVSSRVAV